MTTTESSAGKFGANSWLVEEMYEQFRSDPDSVSETWQEFFEDYKTIAPAPAAAPSWPAAAPRRPRRRASGRCRAAPTRSPLPATAATEEVGEPIRGAGVAIANNMERSLTVPTATSFRNVPAKLLEVNRSVINGYRSRTGQGKVSFTHLIGYAIVRAIADAVPNMNNSFTTGADGKPRIIRNEHVSMGLAVDVSKADGSRTLVVPVFRDADAQDFAGFLAAYEDLIRKVKSNKLAVSDFQGATISLTNPGTIGTVQSVPRLMPGQGVIVGVGSIDYPAEFQGADQSTLGSLGVSKVVTITSTYDHRIVQGAESGMFLKRVHELLLGEHGFYDDVFASLGVPYEAVQWHVDQNPVNREDAMLHKQMQVATLIRVHRVRGHLIADLDPLRWKQPHMPPELDPATYGLTIWDLDREFLTGGVGGTEKLKLGDLLHVLRDAYCRTIGVEYMHIQDFAEQRWIQSKLEGAAYELDKDRKRRIVERLNAAEAFEKFLATKYVGTKRFGSRAPRAPSRFSTRCSRWLPTAAWIRPSLGMAHRGRLNVLANVIGKSYDQIFKEFEGHVDPSSVQGSGDVKYHLGASGKYAGSERRVHSPRTGGQPQPPRDGRPDRAGHGPRHPGQDRPARFVPVAVHPDSRRRRVRRSGHRRRVPRDERHCWLPGGWHHPPHHQQPDRLHHQPAALAQLALLQRRRQDGAGAHLPRQRRRPGGMRSCRRAGVRVPPAVPQRRRHRHGLLPPLRSQRGRRPQLHAAADVQGNRRAPQRAQAVRRGAGQARRAVGRRGRGCAWPTSTPSCSPRSTRPVRTHPSR